MKVVDKLLDWENAGKLKLLSPGYSLRPPELLFRKIEDEEINAQVEKLKANSKINMEEKKPAVEGQQSEVRPQTSGIKPQIQYDDFVKLDLKTGTVIAYEKIEKTDKLLKLEVDLGSEKEQLFPA